RRPAAVLARVRVLLLVDLAQGALDERRRRAEERRGPHPEHRAGPAERDRGRDAADVAHAYAAGERHHERLERGRAVLGPLALLELGEHVGDVPDLEELGPEREVKACQQTERDPWYRPEQTDCCVEAVDDRPL